MKCNYSFAYRHCHSLLALLLCCPLQSTLSAPETPKVRVAREAAFAALEPKEAGPDFAVQGEYVGTTKDTTQTWASQISSLGRGNFRIVVLRGGLPGAGWDGKTKFDGSGRRIGDKVLWRGVNKAPLELAWKNGIVSGAIAGHQIELAKVERRSPTLEAAAPDNAKVLFSGAHVDNWKRGKMDVRHLLAADLPEFKTVNPGPTTLGTFADFKLHLEFRLPFQPSRRGQARGNSGVYLQGRYELQIVDSFGVHLGEDWAVGDVCGEVASQVAPKVNACLPPLAWQTLDVEFKAARFDKAGKKLQPARVTARLNGILIHDNVAIPKASIAGLLKEGATQGPLMLQDHDCPVFYRNIWIVKK
jgi:hypothetical protein